MMLFHHTNAPSATGKKNHSLNAALRRAFTITELVIVIAVIAILAAVLIPTFTSLVNRANESADIQTVKNLNTILSSNEAMGDRADTIDEALQQALDGGYKVENLTPTGDGYDIVWDATNNRFALVDGENKKIYGDALTPETISGQEYWKITDDMSKTDSNFSWYLTEDALNSDDGTTETVEITSSTNLNLSAYTNLKDVTISDTATGTINLTTNSEDVNISLGATTASTATVNLYGTAGTIGIQNQNGTMTGGQYGMNSLHIYGTVDKIFINTGKIIAMPGCSIGTIIATNPISNNSLSIVLETGCSVNNIGTTNFENLPYGVKKPLQDAITGDTSSTTIIVDRLLLTNIYTQGIGTADDPYIITKSSQISSITNMNFGYDYYLNGNTAYFKLGTDIELTARYATVIPSMNLDLAGHTITVKVKDTETVASAFLVQSGNKLTIEDSVGTGSIIMPTSYEEDGTVGYIFDVIGTSSLNINSGNFVAGMTVAQGEADSSIVVNGGTFSTLVPYTNNIYYVLNKIDGSAAQIVVNGGRFKNFDPANAKTDPTETSTPVSYLGSGCTSTQDDSIAGETWWVVTK